MALEKIDIETLEMCIRDRPTTLELGEDGPGRAFNIMPAGLNKGRGIERFCELRGIDRAETLAIGDSESDFLAAPYVGTFVCVENALKDPATPALIAENDNVYLCLLYTSCASAHKSEQKRGYQA